MAEQPKSPDEEKADESSRNEESEHTRRIREITERVMKEHAETLRKLAREV